MVLQIFTAAIVAAFYQLAAHWFPWAMFLRALGRDETELPKVTAYTIGVMGFLVPIVVVLIIWELWVVIWLVVSVVLMSGLAVSIAYRIDGFMNRIVILVEDNERYAQKEAQVGASETRLDSQA